MKTKGELKNAKGGSNQEFLTGVAFGHCKAWLETYASASGEVPQVLTRRVATLLLASSGGEVLGPEERVSGVRRYTTRRTRNATRVPKKNMANGSHRKAYRMTNNKKNVYARMLYRLRYGKNETLKKQAKEWFDRQKAA